MPRLRSMLLALRVPVLVALVALVILAAPAASALLAADGPEGSPGPAAAEPAGPAAWVAALLRRASEIDEVWPGFDPSAIPLAVYDGADTYLFHHPSPPPEFVEDRGGRVFPGRHEIADANSSRELAGSWTATLVARGDAFLEQRVGLLAHEAFHAHQRAHAPDWQGNEADLFTYPFADREVMASRLAEEAALREALDASEDGPARCHLARALAARAARHSRMTAEHIAYENLGELNEGLARYVEARYAGTGADGLLTAGFAPDGVRWRVYETGAAMALLLDRFAPGWKSGLAEPSSRPPGGAGGLASLLSAALAADGAPQGCLPADPVGHEAREAADRRIAEYAERVARREREYLEAAGVRLRIVAAGEPLWPQRFDPLNVTVVGPGRVLHGRMLGLGNGAGRLEVLDRRALTVGGGDHPLFSGVTEVVLTGLPEPPEWPAGGTVAWTAPGVTLELQGASWERRGDEVVLRLGAAGDTDTAPR